MHLNDPFGRVSRRQQQAYLGLRSQLRAQGVDSAQEVDAARRNLGRTTLRLSLIVVALFGAVALLFPAFQAAALVTAGLLLVWLASSFMQTRAHLNRYFNELIDAERQVEQDRPTPPTPEEGQHENTNN